MAASSASAPSPRSQVRPQSGKAWFGFAELLQFERLLGKGSQGQAWLAACKATGAKVSRAFAPGPGRWM